MSGANLWPQSSRQASVELDSLTINTIRLFSYIQQELLNYGHLAPLRRTTMVPATMSYTVLLCWKKSSVMKTGKRNAMDKFLFKARTVDADKVTLDAGTTRTRLGRTRTVESQVTTRRPSKNLPGVAPPAPHIQMIS